MHYQPFTPVDPATGRMDVANSIQLPLSLGQQLTIPAANEHAALFDSTRTLATMTGTLGSSAAVPSTGPDRGFAMAKRFDFAVATVGQAVTVTAYTLDGVGAWQTFRLVAGYDSVTVSAGTRQQFVGVVPGAADFLVLIQVGATPPSALVTDGVVSVR